jgi:hypothetical protein
LVYNDTVSIADDLSTVVAIYDVIVDLVAQGYIALGNASDIIAAVTLEVVDSGTVVNANDTNITLTSTDLLNEFSCLTTLSANDDYMDKELAVDVVNEYISQVLSIISDADLVDSDGEAADAAIYTEMVGGYLDLCNNLESLLFIVNGSNSSVSRAVLG